MTKRRKSIDTRAPTLDTDPGLDASGRVTQTECPTCGHGNPPDSHYCAGCGHPFGGTDLSHDDGGADPLLGRIIADRYRIEELLGRGGMGVVYRVEHVRIAKLMAMKLLHGQLARDKEVVKRFKREAEAVSRLDHPNTVQVFDFGQSEGMTYLVMEYLPGRDLGQVIKEEGALDFVRVARMAAQICGSVAQAHALGIVHRDLKPENIFVLEDRTSDDYVKVLDFGLAKLRDEKDAADRSITRAGSILGTPYYMAPEHIRGETADERSDVYAVGALMFKAIAGVPPFWAATPVGVLTMHLTEDLTPPSVKAPKRSIPEEADAIIMRAMEKDAADRYPSMDALRTDLLEYLESIGEAEGLSTSKLDRVGAAPKSTDSGRQLELATRGDVDRYETVLRRRSQAGYAFLGLIAFAAIGGVGWFWASRAEVIPSSETEPNNELIAADRLVEGVALEATLGARIDEDRSDADIFVIRNPDSERRTVRIDVTAIPNMDIMFEVFREGISTPLLSADSGSIGHRESVPNFVFDGSTYFIRVRELWESGRLPTENVSDTYTITWRTVTNEEDMEREVNDSFELAEEVTLGSARRGYIGWAGDEDVYCLAEATENVVARLEGVERLDLVLEVRERITGRTTRVDANGVGSGELSDVIERAEAEMLCFAVSAKRPKEGLGNDPDHPYTLHIEHEEPLGEDG